MPIYHLSRRSGRGAGGIAYFCSHYHEERNHQGLDNKLIEGDFGVSESGELSCRERLGGLLRYYHRKAA